jgi:hypothetical protein
VQPAHEHQAVIVHSLSLPPGTGSDVGTLVHTPGDRAPCGLLNRPAPGAGACQPGIAVETTCESVLIVTH